MSDLISIKKDLKYGEEQEDIIKPQLESFFNKSLIKNKNKYGTIDFYNVEKDIYIELKSRRINHNQYKTLIIGHNKIKYLGNLNIENKYLVWNCKDGLYYLKYTDNLLKLKPRLFKRNDRYGWSYVVDILTNKLKKI